MTLQDLILSKFLESKEYKRLNLDNTKNITGLKGGSEALLYAALFKDKNKSIVIIKETEDEALAITQELKFYSVNAIYYPDYDTVPFAEMSPVIDRLHDRINVLYQCTNESDEENKIVVVLTVKSLLRLIPSVEDFKSFSLVIKKGDKVDIESLRHYLRDLGYIYESDITDKGMSATRGGIIDIFSPVYEHPLRIELYDDEIESIRFFNLENGKSFKSVESACIASVREAIYDDEAVNDILENGDISEVLKEKIKNKKYFAGSENIIPLFYKNLTSIFSYFNDFLIFTDNQSRIINLFNEYKEATRISFENENNIFKCIKSADNLYISAEEFNEILKKAINITPFIYDIETTHKFSFGAGVSFKSRLNEFLEYIKKYKEDNYLIVLTTSHKEQARRFYKLTEEINPYSLLDISEVNEFNNELNDEDNINENSKEDNYSKNKSEFSQEIKIEIDENIIKSSNFFITIAPSSIGFVYDIQKLIFIADYEVFGRKRKKIQNIPKTNKNIIETFIDLNEGDYAVHVNYGIGRYLGLNRKVSGGKEKDYITLEYAEGDKLYIPVEQMNFVQKYISTGGKPALTKLGGSAWDKIKSKARKDAEETARDLIRLYALRKSMQGTVYGADTEWQDDFEASFKYEETPDQLRAIHEIKKDMESGKMMDRLVCGDVGFGKTEVAFRAVFKAIMAGKQVAILCPTTILSKQHYENALKRFKDFPVKIGVINRFRTSAEVKKIKSKIKDGSLDLIIGTHKLLNPDILFKNLGLIVIDEEQRFGVKHKEALKRIRLETDVLTLSATPIPRTLNMALSGVRDISIIETPPLNRIPVQTFVMEFNEEAIQRAIEKEMSRKGQVFFLYNRVETIDSFAILIKGLCKKARIAVAHGRLSGIQLEKIMADFISHKYDILISTTIIESGIDIPNANTILIDHANRLGLSELYQLRGRVGRSDREAYAYLFYPKNMSLSEIAYKRLEAISEHTDLGAGFKIAMRDLEIRGAGNILGKAQSGMLYQVGYELYTQMLEEATYEYKGEIKNTTFDTVIDLKHNLFIPDNYISLPKEKISAYKLMMRCQDEADIINAKDFLKDKYGTLPREIEEIFKIASLKIVLKRIRILSVIEGEYKIYVALNEYSHIEPDKLLKLVENKENGVYLDRNNFNQIIIPIAEDNFEWKINKIKSVMEALKSDKTDIEAKNKKTKENAISLTDINLKSISREEKNKMKFKNKNKIKIIKSNK